MTSRRIHAPRRALVIALLGCLLLAAPAPAGASEDIVFLHFPQPHPSVRFSNDFGAARSGHSHQGNDLLGSRLMPVVAVADGFVETISGGSTAGNYLVVRHAGGWETWYMHLNNDTPGTDDGAIGPNEALAPDVFEGAYVAAGQLLAWVGDSGNAEGSTPHTHFELHRDGAVINPYPYLVEAWERMHRRWDWEGVAE